MRLFGSDRIARWMDKGGAEEGEVISHPWVTGAISQAQKRVELQNFQARKRLLEYDDVMNQQREVVYSLRLFALERGEQLKAEAIRMVDSAVERTVRMTLAEAQRPEEYDREGLATILLQQFLIPADELTDEAKAPSLERMVTVAKEAAHTAVRRKVEYLQDFGSQVGASDVDSQVLSTVMLTVLDEKWKDHLYDLDQLRNAIQYRAYGQRDPLVEYKKEAFEMFEDLMRDMQATFTERFLKIQVSAEPPRPPAGPPRGRAEKPAPRTEEPPSGADELFAPDARMAPPPLPGARAQLPLTTNLGPAHQGGNGLPEVGRNDPCPCGSGKKYKKCHGVNR
jgi:preprotein translocase subunit SecA